MGLAGKMPNEKVNVGTNINKDKHCTQQEIIKKKYIKYNNYITLENLKTYNKSMSRMNWHLINKYHKVYG